MADQKGKRGLGRGLSALMADVGSAAPDQTSAPSRRADSQIAIEKIRPNPDQPRRRFDKEKLEELAASVREKGVIQPLVLRADPQREGSYQIVAGERRWRAAQIAQLHEVPAVVRDLDDTEVLEIAIIENIQRADLDPIEEAAGYRQLMDRFGHTQEQLSKALGKSRSHIANATRLLGLPSEVQDMLTDGRLTAGHARALITVDDPVPLAREIVRKGLSVRQAEALAKGQGAQSGGPGKAPTRPEKDADTRAIENDLSAVLGMKVDITTGGGESGTLTVKFKDLDQLDELCARLSATRGVGQV